MKRISNSTIVGLFVLSGAILGMGTIIFVASMKLFSSQVTILTYFNESVNGLAIGSPVKFKGVPIGKVKNIMISHNQVQIAGGTVIPVFLEIDLSKVGKKLDEHILVDFVEPENFRTEIDSGLRAKLQLLSFITGQLYVEIDYFAMPGERFQFFQIEPEYAEIPSVRSEMEALGSSASDILAELASLDVRGINDQLIAVLKRLDSTIAVIDAAGINAAVIGTAESLQTTIDSMQLEDTMAEFRVTLKALQSASVKLEQTIDPAVEDYKSTLRILNGTIARAATVMENIEHLTSSDGRLRHELLDTMNAFQQAAKRAEELLSYLERNPNSILSGRGN